MATQLEKTPTPSSALAVPSPVSPPPADPSTLGLRRIPGRIPWIVWPLAFIELTERFSYIGTIVVLVNYIQQPLPPSSPAGAGGHDGQSGALGLGQRVSTAVTTFDTFWSYSMPLLAGWVADAYWGRWRTIAAGAVAAFGGHVLVVASAVPAVLVAGGGRASLGLVVAGIVVMGVGTGALKANTAPLVATQVMASAGPAEVLTTLKTGERVVIDRALTVTRLYMYFYALLNVGAIVGPTGMVYAEKYVGFWLAFVLPAGMYVVCPAVMWVCRRRCVKEEPAGGSTLAVAFRLWRMAMRGRWSWNLVKMYKLTTSPTFWHAALPSHLPPSRTPSWFATHSITDIYIADLARGLRACRIFLWYPIYWLAYNQMNNNLTSQAATLNTHRLPNDFISNLNPIALIILIPVCEHALYPWLRRAGFPLHPLNRITAGFGVAAAALVWAAVLQYYIYTHSACGTHANSCPPVRSLSVMLQAGPYVLIAASEMLAVTTGMEYAFVQAPESMKSLVMAVFLFMAALACVVAQAFVPLAGDPLLVWNYGVMAVLVAGAGAGFWWCSRGMMGDEVVGEGAEGEREGEGETAQGQGKEEGKEEGVGVVGPQGAVAVV
ncbi:PTR2-domain-containing protein [Geopyxis carbonaria]|nr:PTR2-domain-containing protein [Geopyxis carbonaria]